MGTPRALTCLTAALVVSVACSSGFWGRGRGASAPQRPLTHEQEIQRWRQNRAAALTREDGWLSLIGLFWLREGENPFGSDRSNRVIFPKDRAPGLMGSFRVSKGTVSVRINPSVPVTHAGEIVRSMELLTDADGDPTVLRHGPFAFHVIRRGDRLGVRLKDAESAARRAFRGLEYFPIDPSWRLQARFEPYNPPRKMEVPNVLGTPTAETSPGAVVFEVGGTVHRIDAVDEQGSEELFLIFGDATNGHETYGGGRFLYARRPGPDGTLVVDFNKAYSPPCVFTSYATCPLPPPQNKLAVRVEAGEKTYGEH